MAGIFVCQEVSLLVEELPAVHESGMVMWFWLLMVPIWDWYVAFHQLVHGRERGLVTTFLEWLPAKGREQALTLSGRLRLWGPPRGALSGSSRSCWCLSLCRETRLGSSTPLGDGRESCRLAPSGAGQPYVFRLRNTRSRCHFAHILLMCQSHCSLLLDLVM